MMLSFSITKPRHILEQQWAFLVKKGEDNKRDALKRFFIGLLLTTVGYLLFYFITAVNAFIVFKGVVMVLIALAWCAIAVLPTIGLGKARNMRQLEQFLAAISDAQLSYSVEIDEEKVVIVSTDQTHEFLWAEFAEFGIHQETLYVLNSVNGINSLYWDQSEIGSEAYSGLLELLKKKGIRQAF